MSLICFHSINIPSEWESCATRSIERDEPIVSIQLISPASGNITQQFRGTISNIIREFPFN